MPSVAAAAIMMALALAALLDFLPVVFVVVVIVSQAFMNRLPPRRGA
jgi:hypothetical protein